MANLSDKKYYNERKGSLNSKIDFEELKAFFSLIYLEFENKKYFEHAKVKWGRYPGLFIYRKTKLLDVWPIDDKIWSYDESTLFTVIEFLYDYVSEDERIYGYEPFLGCGKIEYREAVNEVLEDYDDGYELSEDGHILKLSPPGFETLIKENIETNDPENIDSRVKYAISKFSRYGASIDDKHEAVRALADVLEYLKKCDIRLPEKDDKELFYIMNKFDIRHHNKDQNGDYDKDVWYDWMFYTFLASINVLLKLNDEKFD
jgi:hypothetical protein